MQVRRGTATLLSLDAPLSRGEGPNLWDQHNDGEEDQRMRDKVKSVALLCLLAVAAAGASASAASAAIRFEWNVNGSPLAAGKTKAISAKATPGHPLTLRSSFGGAAIELSSSQISLESGADIAGGSPGTGEATLLLAAVKVAKPGNCGVKEVGAGEQAEKIKTTLLKPEIVEAATAGAGTGNAELLLAPKTPTSPWAQFEFTGASCTLKGSIVVLKGALLVEAGPQKTEAKVEQLTFEAKFKEYRTSANQFHTTKLEWGGTAATLTGEAETELVSKETFGLF